MERNLTICKECKEIKGRSIDGKYNHKDKRYVDDNGKLWNGTVCPQCHAKKTAERMRASVRKFYNLQVLLFLLICEMVYIFAPYKVVDKNMVYEVLAVTAVIKRHCTAEQYSNPQQISIGFKDQTFGVIAVCRRRTSAYYIEFDPEWWYSSDFAARYRVMAHELVHCMFNEGHSDDPKHFMYYNDNGLDAYTTRLQLEDYLNNKCKK